MHITSAAPTGMVGAAGSGQLADDNGLHSGGLASGPERPVERDEPSPVLRISRGHPWKIAVSYDNNPGRLERKSIHKIGHHLRVRNCWATK